MKLLVLIPLVLMIISDYKTRTVTLGQLVVFGISILGLSLVDNGLMVTWMNLCINILVILCIGCIVFAYFLVKYKTYRAIIGKGDILFILFLTPLFEIRVLIVFLSASFVITLLAWVLSTPKRERDNIPLITGVGACLSALLIYQQLTSAI